MKQNFERVILVLVAVLTVAIMGVSIYFERQMSNQKALFYQLQSLRTSVNLYKAIQGSNPKYLKVLVFDEFKFSDEEISRRYFQGAIMNDEGELIDPFDNPYNYNYQTGWVRSSTKGYEFW